MINTTLSLGFILLAGLVAARLIRRVKLPAVTAYLVLGIIIGPFALNLVSKNLLGASGLISNIVLGFIAFSLGQNFSFASFRKIGRPILWISILGAIGPWVLITAAFLILLRQPFYIALLFGAISAATAPAATVMVVREYKARGSFTDILLGVVAIDDAWCLIIFAVSLAVSKAISAHVATNFYILKIVFFAILEVVGAFLLGGAMAWLLAYFSRYARTPAELLIYTLGLLLLNTGLAIWLGLSVLLANMFLGAVLVNISLESFRFFETLRTVDSPLYLLFFVLVGANLEIPILGKLGLVGICYILFRIVGKIGGAALGGWISRASTRMKRYMGLGLLPQAGVALACALVAKASLPEVGGMILTTIVVCTIIFELIGPPCTRFALDRAGEI